ncbi:hypothetical protein AB1Y20_019176 [Prymnesium parvum]|uniref:Uncharacterized protein n=1 Tax=Prymnesium parvum TaxID=97485 RepID=A0AB34JTQ8_PRYPA
MLHHGVRPLTETELDAIERSPSSDELALDVPHSRLSRKGYFALPSTAVPREPSAVCSLRGVVRTLVVVLLLVAALLFFSASTRSFAKGVEFWRGSSAALALPLARPPSAPVSSPVAIALPTRDLATILDAPTTSCSYSFPHALPLNATFVSATALPTIAVATSTGSLTHPSALVLRAFTLLFAPPSTALLQSTIHFALAAPGFSLAFVFFTAR